MIIRNTTPGPGQLGLATAMCRQYISVGTRYFSALLDIRYIARFELWRILGMRTVFLSREKDLSRAEKDRLGQSDWIGAARMNPGNLKVTSAGLGRSTNTDSGVLIKTHSGVRTNDRTVVSNNYYCFPPFEELTAI